MRFDDRTGRPAPWGVLLAVALLPLGARADEGWGDKASDQKARAPLKKMSEVLASAQDFAIVADEAFDTVDDEGVKLQTNRRRRIWVSRPDRLRSDNTGGTSDMLFVFRKGGFLLLDKKDNSYVAEKGPDTIDGLLDEMAKKY